MNDTALYQQIIGDTSPWFVGAVQLKIDEQTIIITLKLPPEIVWACPDCKERMHIKSWRSRQWRHLDSCQFKTLLEASVPVVECPSHGTQTVQVPWSEGSSRFTLQFERLAIEVLQACSASKAGELLGISWDQADGIKQRAVRRGMAKRQLTGLQYICVDEKAVGHGQDYVTVVTGIVLGKPSVVYIGDGRSEESLNGFWELLGPDGCQAIKAVSMDMSRAYQKSTRRHCPDADIIFDPFHIMKMLNKAVNTVRCQEVVNGQEEEKTALKRTRQMWLWGEENLPTKHAERFDALKASALKTAAAWRIKELWRTFRQCVDMDDGRDFFLKWHRQAMASKLEPIKQVARTLNENLGGIVTVLKHRFCNAMAEGVNSKIQLMIQRACGYRNRMRLKTDILFHMGGLELDPLLAQ